MRSEVVPMLEVKNVWKRYDDNVVLERLNCSVEEGEFVTLVGTSGCGKSTFLRALNRMNNFVDVCVTKGSGYIDGTDIYRTQYTNVNNLRKIVGMVFQKPNPFPKSIYENVAWGARINGYKGHMDDLVEQSLRGAALWEEVKDRLRDNAIGLIADYDLVADPHETRNVFGEAAYAGVIARAVGGIGADQLRLRSIVTGLSPEDLAALEAWREVHRLPGPARTDRPPGAGSRAADLSRREHGYRGPGRVQPGAARDEAVPGRGRSEPLRVSLLHAGR